MSLQIIYGRSGTGKTQYIFNQISQNINNGRKKYIITPEQFSFTAEKELLKNIEKQNNSTSVIDSEVLTFNRMAHRVSAEVGNSIKTVLSNCGKSMLIYNILSDKKSDLKFLGKSENNVEMILTQLTELKKHGVRLEDLEKIMEEVKDSNKYLYFKLNDIYKIYNNYEEKIRENYIDENDCLTILASQLDNSNMFNNCEIYIDEFVGFTKQEYIIIEKLMKVAYKITVVICADCLEESKNSDIDIFYSNKQTISKILNIAKENKISIEKNIFLNTRKRFKNEELKFLEENIYEIPYKTYNKNINNIKLFLANNRYSEIEEIAKQIIKLVRDKNYKYRDISIITKNIELYSSLCKAIFNKFEIPIYIDEKKDLNQNILVKYIISVLDIFVKNWSYDSIFNYLKSGFIEISDNDIYILENYAQKWNIKGSKWYKKEWDFRDEDEIGKEKLDKIKALRKFVVEPLINLKNELSGIKNTKKISEKIYFFLIQNKIDKKLEEKIYNLNSLGYLNIAAEYKTSWKTLMQVLDEIVMLFGEENITFEKYMQILKIGLGNSDLGTIPMAQDQIVIGDIDRSRSHKVKAVFIIGLNDGVFPGINKSEGFLDDNDREFVKKYGIELAKGTNEKIYEENFNIYKAFITAEEELFLLYSSSDIEGKALRPSILVQKIKKIFYMIKEESDIINKTFLITNMKATFEELLINLRDFRDGKEIDEKWFNIYNIYLKDEIWKYKLNNAIQALNYSNIPEKITKENIDKLYKDTVQTSISKLEQYRKCPFSYYLKYGLQLKETDNFKIEAIDTGSFLHDIIDSFFSILDERDLNVKNILDDEVDKIIADIITEKLSLNKNYMFNTTARYTNLANRLKRVVTMSIKYIIQTIKQSEFEIFGHEVEFGKKGKYKPIKISTNSGKTVEIIGKIDRIDVMKNPDGTYVRIIDYKSSIKNIDLNQVIAGLQLQLLTYLNETCKVEEFLPAGILYFNLSEPNIKANKNITDEEIVNKIKQEFKMKGLILADINIIKKMDNNIQDNRISDIIPATIKKDGEISDSKTSGITKNQFEYLQKYMNKILKQISEEMLDGNIELKPYYDTKKQKGKTPCEYCKYKAICRFDVGNKGNSYNYISTFNKETILEMIKEQI